ncbi:MAG: hypothetical protein NWE78_01160 [Candidatus Bathyarchaeota archaeon]|nr:hypothetical protein [Candidatus Bathyarchaeota archaeon]
MPSSRLSIHKAGLLVLKAISAAIRVQTLNLLLENGPMSYTEIMNALKLDATRDAGRFAYHLKTLLKTDLIEPDVETKKYHLTDLGRHVIEITDEIDDRTHKRRKMLVRTSHFSIEEFDRNKIIESLIIEANVPTDIAQRVARETEKRLQQFKTKYITAPLIREIVNTILLEKHYEEYRHNLTRLGLPVHEVARLISAPTSHPEVVHKAAGSAVIEEYTLMNILPRNISDAHLSGSIHIHNLGQWILKPNEIVHSIPSILGSIESNTLDSALHLTANIIRNTALEIVGQQILDNFNVYFAKCAKDTPPNKVKGLLRHFINNINQRIPTPTTITLDYSSQPGIADSEKTRSLAISLLETLAEESLKRPLQNPKIILKYRYESLSKDQESSLYEAHKLAARSNLVYFANLGAEKTTNVTYSASGLRLADEWQKDRDLDVHQAGNLDIIFINLPRVSFEAKGNEEKFFELLDDPLEMAVHALKIKYKVIKERMSKKLLPCLSQESNGNLYFRLDNATRTIGSIGLDEATQSLLGSRVAKDPSGFFSLRKKILEHICGYVKKHTKKPRNRLATAVVPCKIASRRFAKLDAEEYGWGIVKPQGTKETPFYSNINIFSLSEKDNLELEEQAHRLTSGGHLALLETEGEQLSVELLLAMTEQISSSKIGLFAYNLIFAHCNNCRTTFRGTGKKCPNCQSTNAETLSHF